MLAQECYQASGQKPNLAHLYTLRNLVFISCSISVRLSVTTNQHGMTPPSLAGSATYVIFGDYEVHQHSQGVALI